MTLTTHIHLVPRVKMGGAMPLFPRVLIQGDSGGICSTLRNDSTCDSKQKSSYKHVSDFRRLRSYGHFLIPVHAVM
jgi:hypothetical protein